MDTRPTKLAPNRPTDDDHVGESFHAALVESRA
jgi:hypothetical protein